VTVLAVAEQGKAHSSSELTDPNLLIGVMLVWFLEVMPADTSRGWVDKMHHCYRTYHLTCVMAIDTQLLLNRDSLL